VNKELLKSFFIVFLFILVSIPSVLNAPQQRAEELEKQRLTEEQNKILIEEKRTYLLGKFDPILHKDFVKIPLKFTVARTEMYLRREAYDAFVEMRIGAMQDGITLNIASAARNFDYQKGLWENKWNGITFVDGKNLSESIPDGLGRFKKILEYSAAPGTSRHHWGTDIDLGGADTLYFNSEKGKKEYEWLTQNAPLFGFCQTYNLKGSNRPTGYNEERWHWSYLPLARIFTEEYKNLIQQKDILGFAGDAQVSNLNLINEYILSINPDCI